MSQHHPQPRGAGRPLRLAVVGTSLTGLAWAGLFARWGHAVEVAEESHEVLSALRAEQLYADEPGLWPLLGGARDAGQLSFSADWQAAVAQAELVMLAGDPAGDDDRSAWDRLEQQVRTVASIMTPGAELLVVNGLPVGSGARIGGWLEVVRPGAGLRLAVCPEPLRRGEALADVLGIERVVVGIDGPAPAESITRLFAPMGLPLLVTSAASAERIQGASHAFRQAERGFWSEIAALTRRVQEELSPWPQAVTLAV